MLPVNVTVITFGKMMTNLIHIQRQDSISRTVPIQLTNFHKVIIFQQKYVWTSGGPVGFQQYNNIYFDKEIVNYRCSRYDALNNNNIRNLCPNISVIKTAATNILPSQKMPDTVNQKCTLILFSNMKEPDWISVSCNQALLNTIICKSENISINVNMVDENNTTAALHFCKLTTILVSTKCYAFLWGQIGNSSDKFCSKIKSIGVTMNKITFFSHIFNAVSSEDIFPILILQNDFRVQLVQVHKLFGNLEFTLISKHNVTSDGIYICAAEKVKIDIGLNIFHCKNGGYILHTYVCDGFRDCPNDNSDEQICICNNSSFSMKNFCMQLFIKHNRTQCTTNHFMEVTGICKKYEFSKNINTKESEILSKKRNFKKFVCHNGVALDFSLHNDLFSDCGPESEDEPILLSFKTNGKTSHCRPWEIPCVKSHIVCFNITDICVYKLNENYNLIPCRNGGHLENCATFECNMMFKCPNYYCVPWSYVCDGKWDCPFGEDELDNKVCHGKSVCKQMFKCRSEYNKCISISNVCDNYIDCLYHDDELLCD